MMERVSDIEELYSKAREVNDVHFDNWKDERMQWGENPGQFDASNFFIWDVSPSRFNHATEVPEEIVVLPDVYEGFMEGAGFLLRTPLYDDQDFEEAREVLGEENLVGNGGGGFRGVEELDTPKDVMQMHQLADRLDIDIYTPSEWDYGLPQPERTGYEALDEWREAVYGGIGNFVDDYTTNATGRWAKEVIDEFAENGNRTTFITYASRNGGYTEDDIEYINQANQGGLSYHTPFTVNQVLGGNILDTD